MEKCQIKKDNDNVNKKCKFCASIFATNTDYLQHIESKHKEDNSSQNAFMCSDCGKQYRSKSELTLHIKSKCGTLKQFKCKVCGQNLMSAGSLYNHMIRHRGERSYMCRFCAKLFFTAGQLKVHERIHTQDKAYVCEVCNKGFCHRQSLITHSTLHTGIKPYQCENCGNSFSCVGNLIKHRKTHADTCGLVPLTTHRVQHPSTKYKVKINTPANCKLKHKQKEKELEQELRTLKNELQGEEATINDNVKEVVAEEIVKVEESLGNSESSVDHEDSIIDLPEFTESSDNETNHETRKSKRQTKKKNPKYEENLANFVQQLNFHENGYGDCRYCSKRYTNVRWLFKHVKEHEETVDKLKLASPHKCSCCKMSFNTKEECLSHQQATHADLLTCQDCYKIFANRDSLRSHQKVFHRGIGRKTYLYICEKCGKQFKQKSDLMCHESRNCIKGPFYECPTCKKEFSSKHTRNNHMRIHDPEKKLSCKFCSKTFHWKGQLKIHERSHTGEKPFACLYCPKAFAYRESLITHSTIHTGIKPHLCEGCGSRFSCIGNLIKHRSTHVNQCGAWNYKTQMQNQKQAEINFA